MHMYMFGICLNMFRVGKVASPTASLMLVRSASLREALQFNETEATNLKEEIIKLKDDLDMYQSTNKKQSQALLRLKEELNIAKVHVYTIHSVYGLISVSTNKWLIIYL